MTAIKLKNIIRKKLSMIEDVEILNSINLLLESKSPNSEIYRLNEDQRERIKKSKLQFKEGMSLSNEKAFGEIEQWLKKQ